MSEDALTPRELDIFALTLHQVMASHEKLALIAISKHFIRFNVHLITD